MQALTLTVQALTLTGAGWGLGLARYLGRRGACRGSVHLSVALVHVRICLCVHLSVCARVRVHV